LPAEKSGLAKFLPKPSDRRKKKKKGVVHRPPRKKISAVLIGEGGKRLFLLRKMGVLAEIGKEGKGALRLRRREEKGSRLWPDLDPTAKQAAYPKRIATRLAA